MNFSAWPKRYWQSFSYVGLAVATLLFAASLTPSLLPRHYLTQGLLSTLVADAAPAELRGTAFGVFHLVSGVAMLLASVIAGVLWDAYGPAGTFYAGAAFTALALLGLLAVRRSP